MSNVENLTEVFTEYFGSWYFPSLLFLALLLLFVKGTKKIRIYSGITVICLLFIYNPFFYGLCRKAGMGSEYYRFLWMLPVTPLGAVFLAKCRERIKYKWLQVIFLGLIFALAFQTTDTYVTKTEIAVPENKYGVSDRILELIESLNAVKETGEPVILCDEWVALRIRQLEPAIKLAVTRNTYLRYATGQQVGKRVNKALKLVTQGRINGHKRFLAFVEKYAVDYVILSRNIADGEYMQELNCTPVAETADYIIFKVT